MEQTLAVLMAFGIFMVIPVLIGFAIVGACTLCYRLAHKVKQIEVMKAAEDVIKGPTKKKDFLFRV